MSDVHHPLVALTLASRVQQQTAVGADIRGGARSLSAWQLSCLKETYHGLSQQRPSERHDATLKASLPSCRLHLSFLQNSVRSRHLPSRKPVSDPVTDYGPHLETSHLFPTSSLNTSSRSKWHFHLNPLALLR